jgi:hypothetical protein
MLCGGSVRERDRRTANIKVCNADIVQTTRRWQHELGGHVTYVGDQNVHEGEAGLGAERLNTGPHKSYSKLDELRGTP